MKSIQSLLFLCLAVLPVALTSCNEDTDVDISGPDIEFSFDYSDLRVSNSVSTYRLIAESDTIYGKNIQTFLADKGQEYNAVVPSAGMKDIYLMLNDGYTFSGVDSIQIRYRIAGTQTERVLAEAAIGSSSSDSLRFSNVIINKEEVFEFISNDIIASLYASYNTTNPTINCFQTGVKYTFKAKTVLTVNVAALAN